MLVFNCFYSLFYSLKCYSRMKFSFILKLFCSVAPNQNSSLSLNLHFENEFCLNYNYFILPQLDLAWLGKPAVLSICFETNCSFEFYSGPCIIYHMYSGQLCVYWWWVTVIIIINVVGAMCQVSLCSGMLLAIKHWGWMLTEWLCTFAQIYAVVYSQEYVIQRNFILMFPVYYCPSVVSFIVMMILILLLTTKCGIDYICCEACGWIVT